MLLGVLHSRDGLRMPSADTLKLTLSLLKTSLGLLSLASDLSGLALRTLERSLLSVLLVLCLLKRLPSFSTLLRPAFRLLLLASVVSRVSWLRALLLVALIARRATLGRTPARTRRGYRATQEAEPDRASLVHESAGSERGPGVLIQGDGLERLLRLLESRLARGISCTVKQPVGLVEQGGDRLGLAISSLTQVVSLAMTFHKPFVCLTEGFG